MNRRQLAAELSPAEHIAETINKRHGFNGGAVGHMTAEHVRKILMNPKDSESHPIVQEVLGEANRLSSQQPTTKKRKPRKK